MEPYHDDAYRLLLEELPDAFAHHQLIEDARGQAVDYRFLHVNKAFEKMTGLSKDRVLGKRVTEVLPSITSANFDWIDHYAGVARTGESVTIEEYSEPLGRWYEVKAFSIEEGYFSTLFRDITATKEMEKELIQSEEKYRSLIDQSLEMLFLHDLEGAIVEVNREAVRSTGYTEEELLTMNVFDLHTDTSRQEEIKGQWKRWAVGEEPVIIEDYHVHAGGVITPVEIATGKVSIAGEEYILALVRDTTHRQEAEKRLEEWQKLMQYIIRHDPNAIAVHDRDLKYIYVSDRYLQDYNVRRKDVIGKHHYEIFPDIPQEWREVHQRALAGEVITSEEDCFVRSDGSAEYTRWQCRPWYQGDGSIGGIILYTEVITRRKKTEKALQEAEEKYRALVHHSQALIYTISLQGKMTFASPSLKTLLGYEPEEIMDVHVSKFIHPQDVQIYQECIEKTVKTKSRQRGVDYRALHKDGSIRWHRSVLTPVFDSEENLTLLVGNALDFTERKAMEDKLRYMSFHDTLTGLYNRNYLEEEIENVQGKELFPLSIIMVDVNGLKLVNDTYGSVWGDEMLRNTAWILRQSCRKQDIIARWGGDEFIIVLPETTENEGNEMVKAILQNCRGVEVKDIPLSLSLGLSCMETEGKDLTTYVKEAEDIMNQHKLTELRSAKSATLEALLKTLAEKSFETEAHTRRMQELALKVGLKMGLPESELSRLHLLITLHDIGKINISEAILTKTSSLNQKEWEIIKEHPEIGYRIAQATPEFAHVAEEILSHHERYDGTGYPRGLQGKAIPLLARITTVVDAYEVMSNGRPYKTPMSKEEIVSEFRRCAGKQFDPKLVDIFIPMLNAE